MSNEATDPGMPPPEVLEAWARDCRCCQECESVPCPGVMQGAVCDQSCRCDDRDDSDDYDPNACPGCGGNCWTACR